MNERLGIVSNCWRVQLAQGESIESLLEKTAELGYRTVELRQTCLGSHEAGRRHVPNPESLAQLPERFPDIEFNLALALPFEKKVLPANDSVLAAGVESAHALAGRFAPHLRIVDPYTSIAERARRKAGPIAKRVAAMTRPLIRMGGVFSIENAARPWVGLWDVFQRARKELRQHASHLRLCYDPCNLFFTDEGPAAGRITRSLHADDLGMFHFKQFSAGQHLPTVSDGDVDWPDQLDAVRAMDYHGPALFEIASSEDVWAELQKSREYLGL